MIAERLPRGSLVRDRRAAYELYQEFFGNPLGRRKFPRGRPFDRPLVLDPYETIYLARRRGLKVYKSGRPLGPDELEDSYAIDPKAYRVYEYLRDRGYIVRSGSRFGAEFLVYTRGPDVEHAPYVVVVSDSPRGLDIVRVSRLAGSVRKAALLAVADNDVRFFRIRRFKELERNSMILDRFGRPLKKLRASVTPRCNFRCFFCHREGITRNGPEMSPEDFGFVARVLSSVGIREVKLTGGEPLVRPDIADIVAEMAAYMRVSMTTNGFFLKRYAKSLAEAGLERINVSLHALDPRAFRRIVRVNADPSRILEGISEALKYMPVKLDVVLLSYNVARVPEYIELAARMGFDLQFIELMGDYPQKIDPMEVEKFVARRAREKFVRRDMQNRVVYVLDNGVRVEFVKPENRNFCIACTRIRLSHDGRFMPCLRLPIGVNARPEIEARDEKGLLKKLMMAVKARSPFVRPERTRRPRSAPL